jgi:hypothetical protein
MPAIGDNPTSYYTADFENTTFIPESIFLTDLNSRHTYALGRGNTSSKWFGRLFAKKSNVFASTGIDSYSPPVFSLSIMTVSTYSPMLFLIVSMK